MRPLPAGVPTTLEEAVEVVVAALEDADRDQILATSNEAAVHLGFGMYLRNRWGLWTDESPLRKHFQERFGLGHADDISGIICTSVWASVYGVPFDPEPTVARFKEHWARYGVDPLTGRKP